MTTQTSNLVSIDLFLDITALAAKHGCEVTMKPDGSIVLSPPDIGSVTVTIDPAD